MKIIERIKAVENAPILVTETGERIVRMLGAIALFCLAIFTALVWNR